MLVCLCLWVGGGNVVWILVSDTASTTAGIQRERAKDGARKSESEADQGEQEIKCLHLSLPDIIVRMRAAIEIWRGCGASDT